MNDYRKSLEKNLKDPKFKEEWDKLEDEFDLMLYKKACKENAENQETYTFEEVCKELGISMEELTETLEEAESISKDPTTKRYASFSKAVKDIDKE